MFANRIAIVTGAASGIGRAVSTELVRRGASVVLVDKNAEGVKAVAQQLATNGATARAEVVDVREPAAVAEMVARTAKDLSRIDFMFNNAGVGILAEARDTSLEDWRYCIETNLMGVIHGVNACYPIMIAQGRGHIVNTASLSGLVPMPGNISYVASKYGVVGLSHALRIEAEAHGVRVSVVCPAAVSTSMLLTSKAVKMNPERVKAALPDQAITPDACAQLILRGVEQNRETILPNVATYIAWAHRHAPFLTRMMARTFARKLAELREA